MVSTCHFCLLHRAFPWFYVMNVNGRDNESSLKIEWKFDCRYIALLNRRSNKLLTDSLIYRTLGHSTVRRCWRSVLPEFRILCRNPRDWPLPRTVSKLPVKRKRFPSLMFLCYVSHRFLISIFLHFCGYCRRCWSSFPFSIAIAAVKIFKVDPNS